MADVFAAVPPEKVDENKKFLGKSAYGHSENGEYLFHFQASGRTATDAIMDEIEDAGGVPSFHDPNLKR